MSTLAIVCPHCSKVATITAGQFVAFEGKAAKCKACQKSFVLVKERLRNPDTASSVLKGRDAVIPPSLRRSAPPLPPKAAVGGGLCGPHGTAVEVDPFAELRVSSETDPGVLPQVERSSEKVRPRVCPPPTSAPVAGAPKVLEPSSFAETSLLWVLCLSLVGVAICVMAVRRDAEGNVLNPEVAVAYIVAAFISAIADACLLYANWKAVPDSKRPYGRSPYLIVGLTFVPAFGYWWYWRAYADLGRIRSSSGFPRASSGGIAVTMILSVLWLALWLEVIGAPMEWFYASWGQQGRSRVLSVHTVVILALLCSYCVLYGSERFFRQVGLKQAAN